MSGARSNTIVVLRVDRAKQRAGALSIPRDTWVDIAGTNSYNRINAAPGHRPAVRVRAAHWTLTPTRGDSVAARGLGHVVRVDRSDVGSEDQHDEDTQPTCGPPAHRGAGGHRIPGTDTLGTLPMLADELRRNLAAVSLTEHLVPT